MIYIETGATSTDKPCVLYDNIFLDGTLSGSDTTGFELSNAISGSTFDYWQPPDATWRSIIVTLAGQTAADCVFIDAHDIATVGADVKVQRSTDAGVSWIDVTDWITPSDNTPIMIFFPSSSGDAWRVSQRNGPASIGVVILGEKLAFEYGVEDMVSFRHGHKVEIMGGDTLGGQFVGQKVRRKGGSTSFSFPWLTASWVNNTMAMFEAHYNDGLPFGMSIRPDYDLNEVAYCWRPEGVSELSPRYTEMGKAFNMTMDVKYYVA